jgi:hypothetical protein
VSYRSWLEDVTNYRELGRHCRLLSMRASTQAEVEREWERETELWIERLNAPVPVDPSIAKYFVTGEHDSWLLGFTRERKEARLSLHSIKGECFIEAYATAHGLAVPDVIGCGSGSHSASSTKRCAATRAARNRPKVAAEHEGIAAIRLV